MENHKMGNQTTPYSRSSPNNSHSGRHPGSSFTVRAPSCLTTWFFLAQLRLRPVSWRRWQYSCLTVTVLEEHIWNEACRNEERRGSGCSHAFMAKGVIYKKRKLEILVNDTDTYLSHLQCFLYLSFLALSKASLIHHASQAACVAHTHRADALISELSDTCWKGSSSTICWHCKMFDTTPRICFCRPFVFRLNLSWDRLRDWTNVSSVNIKVIIILHIWLLRLLKWLLFKGFFPPQTSVDDVTLSAALPIKVKPPLAAWHSSSSEDI